MNIETRTKYDDFILSVAKEIAEEQDNCNNLDYKLPILNEYYMFFNNDFFANEILPVVVAQIINLGKSKRVGKFDNESPKSYKRFVNRRDKLNF